MCANDIQQNINTIQKEEFLLPPGEVQEEGVEISCCLIRSPLPNPLGNCVLRRPEAPAIGALPPTSLSTSLRERGLISRRAGRSGFQP